MSHLIPALMSGAFSIVLAWIAGTDHARITGSSRLYLSLSVMLMLAAIFVEYSA